MAANLPVTGRYSLLFTVRTALATAARVGLASLYPTPGRGACVLLPAAVWASQAAQVQVLTSLGQVVRPCIE